MSTSPLLPCKDPPLLHRLTLRASSSQQHSMDEDPRSLVHNHHSQHLHQLTIQHHGGDRRLPSSSPAPALPPRLVGTTRSDRRSRPPPTPPVPARPERRRASPTRPPPPQLDREVITLAGRSGPRTVNEYVDNPGTIIRQSNNNQINPTIHNNNHETNTSLLNSDRSQTVGNNRSQGAPPIRTQPQPTTGGVGWKDHSKGQNINPASDELAPISPHHPSQRRGDEEHESIFCKRCGKCKCHDCTSPRELPSRWICDQRYECSANQMVEYCSCLRCVKCIFYHCENSEDNMSTADVPCACCERPHCCKRWTCMGLMSVCVPCLCLYWPLRALVGLSTMCYNGCSRRGCQCHRDNSSGQTLTKRPLIDSESSSA